MAELASRSQVREFLDTNWENIFETDPWLAVRAALLVESNEPDPGEQALDVKTRRLLKVFTKAISDRDFKLAARVFIEHPEAMRIVELDAISNYRPDMLSEILLEMAALVSAYRDVVRLNRMRNAYGPGLLAGDLPGIGRLDSEIRKHAATLSLSELNVFSEDNPGSPSFELAAEALKGVTPSDLVKQGRYDDALEILDRSENPPEDVFWQIVRSDDAPMSAVYAAAINLVDPNVIQTTKLQPYETEPGQTARRDAPGQTRKQ